MSESGSNVKKFGVYMGRISLYRVGTSLMGTFVKALEGNGVKEKDECEIFYSRLEDGRYAVTFVEAAPKAEAGGAS